MRRTLIPSALCALSLMACGPSDTEGGDSTNNSQGGGESCPFTYDTPTLTFTGDGTPSLLSFPIFEDLDNLDVQGEEGNITQFRAYSVFPFLQDERINNGASIGYIQNMNGLKVLFFPDEVDAEFDRTENNARQFLDAETSRSVIEIDGVTYDVLYADAPASKEATIMIPVFGGEFFHPVTVGVYPGLSGCDETTDATFDYVMENLTVLNTNANYTSNDQIVEIAQDKRANR